MAELACEEERRRMRPPLTGKKNRPWARDACDICGKRLGDAGLCGGSARIAPWWDRRLVC